VNGGKRMQDTDLLKSMLDRIPAKRLSAAQLNLYTAQKRVLTTLSLKTQSPVALSMMGVASRNCEAAIGEQTFGEVTRTARVLFEYQIKVRLLLRLMLQLLTMPCQQ